MDIYLRDITLDDAEMVVNWRNDENVKKYFIYQEDFTVEGQIQWIEKKVKTGNVIQCIICLKEDDKPIGTVYLRDIDRLHKKAEYGIFIGETMERGKGYGTQAAELILKRAFEEEGLHRVYLRAFSDNKKAISSYENVGFKYEGLLKDDVFVNGEFRDIVWMAKVKCE